jgi:hypothetical protein
LVRESSRLRVSPLTANYPQNASGKLLAFAIAPADEEGNSAEQAPRLWERDAAATSAATLQ